MNRQIHTHAWKHTQARRTKERMKERKKERKTDRQKERSLPKGTLNWPHIISLVSLFQEQTGTDLLEESHLMVTDGPVEVGQGTLAVDSNSFSQVFDC